MRGVWVFHLVMMFGSIYMAMLLTAWGDESSAAASGDGDISIDSGDKGHNSMWAKIISQVRTRRLPCALPRATARTPLAHAVDDDPALHLDARRTFPLSGS